MCYETVPSVNHRSSKQVILLIVSSIVYQPARGIQKGTQWDYSLVLGKFIVLGFINKLYVDWSIVFKVGYVSITVLW